MATARANQLDEQSLSNLGEIASFFEFNCLT